MRQCRHRRTRYALPSVKIIDRYSIFPPERIIQVFVIFGSLDIKDQAGLRRIYAGQFLFIAASAAAKNADIVESSSDDFLGIQIDRLQGHVSASADYLLGSRGGLREIEGRLYGKIDEPIADGLCRMLELQDAESISFVCPLIQREIAFRITRMHIYTLGKRGATLDDKIERSVEWIRQNYRSECRISTAAKSIGVGRTYLHREFKDKLGMSPVDYRTSLRMKEAQRLMLVDRLTPTQAAGAVGYQSMPPFSRAYSQFFGYPPSKEVRETLSSKTRLQTHSQPERESGCERHA